MQKVLRDKKYGMLKIEAKAASTCERIRVWRSIWIQPFAYYKLNSNKRILSNQFGKNDFTSTRDYILNSYWMSNDPDSGLFIINCL